MSRKYDVINIQTFNNRSRIRCHLAVSMSHIKLALRYTYTYHMDVVERII